MAPDVSVIIPTYRRPIPLGESIRSALGQEGVDVEVHVIDDSPEGAGQPVVDAINDARVVYERMPSPTGGLPSPTTPFTHCMSVYSASGAEPSTNTITQPRMIVARSAARVPARQWKATRARSEAEGRGSMGRI